MFAAYSDTSENGILICSISKIIVSFLNFGSSSVQWISKFAVTAHEERSTLTVKTTRVVKAMNKKKSFGFLTETCAHIVDTDNLTDYGMGYRLSCAIQMHRSKHDNYLLLGNLNFPRIIENQDSNYKFIFKKFCPYRLLRLGTS